MGVPNGAGSLNRLCQFQIKTETTTALGGPSESWSNAFRARCAFTFSKGLEYPKVGARDIIAEKRQGQDIATAVIRYRPGIDVDTHRIIFLDKTWNITNIRREPNARPVYLEIDVMAVI